MINRDDEEHLAAATVAGRALYTFNVADYCILHHSWISRKRAHVGIIVAPQQRYSTGEEIRRLMRSIGAIAAEGSGTPSNSYLRGASHKWDMLPLNRIIGTRLITISRL